MPKIVQPKQSARVSFYIDGFNLYYGSLKNSPYQWLDIEALCRRLFSHSEIVAIKYFTTLFNVRSDNQKSDEKELSDQQNYWRALRTTNIEIIQGFFLTHAVWMKPLDGGAKVRVYKTEEKGTDVNIASHLVFDAAEDRFDIGVVISNDSDLVEPIKIARQFYKKYIIVVTPYKHNAIELRRNTSSVRRIRKSILAASQFPDKLVDDVGQFHKPKSW